MSRVLTASEEARLLEAQTGPRYFVEMVFDSGTVRLWDGLGDKTFDGNTYVGSGRLGTVEPIPEESDVVASGVRLKLIVIPTTEFPNAVDDFITIAYGEEFQGRACTVWRVELDDAGAIIPDGIVRFRGRMDMMHDTEIPGALVVTVTAENRLIDLEYVSRKTYTPEDWKRVNPNNTFFDNVASIQNREIQLSEEG
jgi:hypothetical protein